MTLVFLSTNANRLPYATLGKGTYVPAASALTASQLYICIAAYKFYQQQPKAIYKST
jgi:hypothetical protein